MSDSELSSAPAGMPPDETVEKELRNVIRDLYKSKKLDELTVRRVRAAVEKALQLDEGVLKEKEWKDKSKSIIDDEVARQEESYVADADAPSSPEVKEKKRASQADPQPSKRKKLNETAHSKAPPPKSSKSRNGRAQKQTAVESSGSDLSDIETSLDNGSKSKAAKEEDDSSELSDVIDEESKPKRSEKATKPPAVKEAQKSVADDDSSELSDVIDEDPKPKRSRKSGQSASTKSGAKKGRAKSAKPPENEDPDESEIKKLKSQLSQCGIRKMWYKELQPYDTPKSKIKHLRQMLVDAGMVGKFSKEKASQIRDARELAADLEAVQAADRRWGKKQEAEKEAGEEEEEDRPKRRLARGLEGLDFLNDDDGEETD